MKKITIAVDGYSACGKSSTAKHVAAALQYSYIDTGAMYRAVTLYFLEHYVSMTNPKDITKALDSIDISFRFNTKRNASDTFLNGINVENKIRTMEVNNRVSEVSAIPEVRQKLASQQRKMGKNAGVVMDGRDIGTVIFPDAELKLFMVADLEVRSERSQKELLEKNKLVPLDEITENLKRRDHIDTTREESPLRKAEDAIEIDTTHFMLDEQVEYVIRLATERILSNNETLINHDS